MRIVYRYNEKLLELNEAPNEDDIEFNLTFFDKAVMKRLEKIKEFFDQNNIITDILIYRYSDKHVQIIVRNDFYQDFVLQLFKQHLLCEINWE